MKTSLLSLFALLITLPFTAIAQTAFQGAQWLRDPRFKNEPTLGIFDVHRKKSQEARLKNIHTYFRKSFNLQTLPQRAVLRFTADDYAKLYINGTFVIQGPEPAYPFAHPYYDVDVTKYLCTGENVLAAHTYYHGLATRAFNSADNRSGLIAQLVLTTEGLPEQRIVTDKSWRCFASRTFSSDKVFGYETQFNENMDLNLEPINWRKPGFADTTWSAPLTGFQDHTFIAAITAPLQHTNAFPIALKQTETNRWFADMGTEVVGHTRIRVKGYPGQIITVWHGEELSAPNVVRHKMRCNCDYVDQITLTEGNNLIEFFDYRAFRYVEIIGTTNTPDIQVDVRHYPFEWTASSCQSSDTALNRIWEISKRGVQMGSQGIFVDCPSREKGQYTGDTYMTVLSQLLLTGDPSLTRKALIDFQQTQRFDPGMLCVAPGGFWQELAEWSLLWPQMVVYYYRVTGDKALVKTLVEAGATEKLMRYFSKLEREDGLLSGVDRHKWVLVDWPSNLRGGYDYDKTKNGVNTVINAFYYGSLLAVAEMMRIADRPDLEYTNKAERLEKAFNKSLLDPASGLYIDGIHEDDTRSSKTSLHANGFPLYFGLVPETNQTAVVNLIRQQRLNCGIYGGPYFIAALFKNGHSDLAYDLLTSKDTHSWNQMLKEGATTTFEAWGADQKWNTSLCHPAAGMPVWIIIEHLMGLTPAEPGFKTVRVAPRIPAALTSIEVRFPTVSGTISALYKKDKGYFLSVPENTPVIDDTPQHIKLKLVNTLPPEESVK
ncbi:MAG: family 78 glycoside hydrolase catalytic domain [Kiritimatiellae bacterium]|jgi:alpha-L-rhamnosidase|nr:family 78 glycoside hydrolase catalytic domain [Kiritimatiellia bacterium]